MKGQYHGCVCFSGGRKIWSRLINLFGGTKISHTSIGFLDGFVIEAVRPQVKISRLSKYKKNKLSGLEIYKIVGISQAKIDKALENTMTTFLDVPYGVWQLIGYMPVILMKVVFGKTIKNPWFNLKERAVCANITLHYLRNELKMKEFKNVDSNEPNFLADVYHIVRENPKKFKKIK
jgi:hypothetical protein